MRVSIRLDARSERLLRRLARLRGQTKSEVMREAIARLTEQEGLSGDGKPSYAAVSHLIGSVQGGPPDLSEQTGLKFRRLLHGGTSRRK
jgi:hypothetical protein